MPHSFANVPHNHISRSRFDRSHGHKSTFDAGYLVPIFVDEALPGDDFHLRASMFARLSTPLKPIMDNLYIDTFWFAVPTRLVWDNFKKFMGEQKNPGDSTDYLVPQLVAPKGGWKTHSLSDYFGLPTGVNGLSVSSFFHRCYNLIWNEWFRDQNLQDSVPVPTGDGPDKNEDFKLLKRGKRHDYFTSCLPWTQKGDPVSLPLGGFAKVVSDGKDTLYKTDQGWDFRLASVSYDGAYTVQSINNPPVSAPFGHPFKFGSQTGLQTDLSSATAVTVNALRQAIMMQNLLETDARGGTRYIEIVRAHFGVTSPDARQQRPEFLGSSSEAILVKPIPQTSSTDGVSPQGNLSAMGVASPNAGFHKAFTEHTIIIGLASVRADLTYQQGVNRMFSRRTRFDFYLPALAHLGEQAVLNKEIYAQGNEKDDEVFGYQERWAEYRYCPSKITGKFRSSDPQPLDVWHLSQSFKNLPTLSKQFIEENPPVERVLAQRDEPHILFDAWFNLHCIRPMPVYSVPGLGARF